VSTLAQPGQRWIYGPVPDLLFGCAGIYLVLLPLLLIPTLSDWASGRMSAITACIGLAFNSPHYGATLLRVYQHRQDRRKYALFAYWVSALLFALFVAATRSPALGAVLVTVYVTWSPWHFAGQNYGLALLFLRRRGVAVTPGTKRLFYASFLLSFALAFFTIHGSDSSRSVAPVPTASQMDEAVYHQLSMGIPDAVAAPVTAALAVAYVAVLLASAIGLLRRGRPRDLLPAALLVLMQAAWFSAPALLRMTDRLTTQHVALASIWISGAHSLQYLWITSYYARKTDEPAWMGRYLAKALLAGTALMAIPALLFAPRALGVVPFASFAILLFSVINIHHFILDGAVWKLRDGRVASALLRASPPEPVANVSAEGGVGRRALVLGGWAVGLAALGISIVGHWEREQGARALQAGNYDRAIVAADRLWAIGRESATQHARVAYAMWQRGLSPRLVLEQYRRSLAIRPTAATWIWLGQFHLRPQLVRRDLLAPGLPDEEPVEPDPDAALAAFERALELDPTSLPALLLSGSLLAERGELERAQLALERARGLAPDDPLVKDLARRLSTARTSH
jgi:tetratricopeptide (TPR) repeat protein